MLWIVLIWGVVALLFIYVYKASQLEISTQILKQYRERSPSGVPRHEQPASTGFAGEGSIKDPLSSSTGSSPQS